MSSNTVGPDDPDTAAAAASDATAASAAADSTENSRSSQQQKRPASTVEQEEEQAKRQRQEEQQQVVRPQPAPIYLFATATDVQARRGHGRDHWSRKQCLTLREMLGIGDYNYRDDSTSMGPIDFLFIANYIINFEFLLDESPEILSLPRAVCIYGSKEGTEDAWRQACTTLDGQCSVDFLCRNPSDDKGSDNNPLSQKIPFGVHHTKLFLVGFSSGLLRVVIHTANLRFSDIHHKAQGAYIQDFSRKSTTTTTTTSCNDFEDSLVDYLESYKYNKQHKWDDHGNSTPTTLTQHLRKYDFSTACVTLIPSIPGYHKLHNNNRSCNYGHLKVRSQVANLNATSSTAAARSGTNSNSSGGRITLQFSSIGSLTKKYLHRLACSMDIDRAAGPGTVGKNASAGGQNADDENDESKPLNLQLVYPTSDEICNSLEGYRGGNSVPGNKKNVSKDFLRPLYRKWAASLSFLSSLSLSRKDDSKKTNPLWKGNNVPHIKSYFQLSSANDDDDDAMAWFMIGSQNLSKAAWGDVQDSKTFGEKRFFIRHWELGVFLSPQHLHAKRLLPWTPERDKKGKQNHPDDGEVTVPLPYRVKPIPYTESDKPWAVDERYVRLDIFGRRSASDS